MSSPQLNKLAQALADVRVGTPTRRGVLVRVTGMILAARGIKAPLGACCEVVAEDGAPVACEVVGFQGGEVMLMPFGGIAGLRPGAPVGLVSTTARVGVGQGMLGRVIDGLGMPFDGGPAIEPDVYLPLRGERLNPLQRSAITRPMDVGVRSLNCLLTIGEGQRVGLIAGSGVGKSVLLGMMTRFTQADAVVIGAIGERGREVLDFVTETLGDEALRKAVVVASPGDCSPVLRVRAAHLSCTIAEYLRNAGQRVLLLMDSLTRVAHAQREIGLAVGEPPTTRGYTPSVFSLINEIVERAGNVAVGGSITGIYTVLAEGDDANDPIVDAARAILDGHVLLSRDLAAQGQYPAVDLGPSVSRLAGKLTSPEQRRLVTRFRRLHAVYEEGRDLLSVGAYRQGANPELDLAIEMHPKLVDFLCQDADEAVDYAQGFRDLERLLQ